MIRRNAAVDHCAVVGLLALVVLSVSGCSTGANGLAAPTSGPPTGVTPSTPTTPAPTASGPEPTQAATTSPADTSAPSGAVTKVLVFVEENHSLSEMRAEMPFTVSLAERFGYATGYTAIRHPSLPNYIAIAGGGTHGITNDDPPAANPVAGASVFGQAVAAHRTAAVYAEGMSRNCATENGGADYAVKHNPWAYFTDERPACRLYDVPVGRLSEAVRTGDLPNAGMVIPNLCHDAHDCSLGEADTWFKNWMTTIFAGPDWRSGHLLVVLTADEDDKSAGNQVLTVVIHPSQRGKVVTSPLTHYSLTRLYEEVTGTALLSNAASAPSMTKAFGLPLK